MSEWTEEREKAARERCRRTTSGPWWVHPQSLRLTKPVVKGYDLFRHKETRIIASTGCGNRGPSKSPDRDPIRAQEEADAEFIAAAREDLPDALNEIQRLRRELEAAKGHVSPPVPAGAVRTTERDWDEEGEVE